MTWRQQLESLRWRSLEDADLSRAQVPTEIRTQATAAVRREHRADTVEVMSKSDIEMFVIQRSAKLKELMGEAQSAIHELKVPSSHLGLVMLTWVVAFFGGIGITGLGTEREINLLSLPLVGIVIWNAVVMLFSLASEAFWRSSEPGQGKPWWTLMMRSQPRETMDSASVKGLFHSMTWPLVMEQARSRLRVWLHVAAALLAVGTCVGLYAKGWSREYTAVWESTLLDADQVRLFFSALFSPSSHVFGLSIPLEEIPMMQRGKHYTADGVPALPWIHLYAGTLVLGVVVPRLILAGVSEILGAKRVRNRWHGLGWRDQIRIGLREIEGGTDVVEVIVHGTAFAEDDQIRWRRAFQAKMGGMIMVRFANVASGSEDEFAEGWSPISPHTWLLFSLAATPEEEVHQRLAGQIHERLSGRFPDARLKVLIDMHGLRGRWDKSKIQSRTELWIGMLKREVDEMEILTESEVVNPLRVPMSEAR